MECPLWFLLLALFLPRVSLGLAAYSGEYFFESQVYGILPLAMGLLVPRILVVILIYATIGWSWWLVPHAFGIAYVYAVGGSVISRP